jgi:glycosyltransferase involved in cell wall biosynthesis
VSERRTISVVVPAYNEEEVLVEFHGRLTKVLDALAVESEVVYVDDGSSDATLSVLANLKAGDARVAVVGLSRNFGKEAALTAGLHHAKGDAVLVIDADLQDPPELIGDFVHLWQEGADIVYGQRLERDGETLLKRATASAFYRIMQRFGRVKIPRDTGDFRLLDRRAVTALNQLPERHRFMKGLFTWVGFRQVAYLYKRDSRHAGATKFNYWRLWNFAIEGITSYTVAPLQVSSYFGICIAILTILYAVYIIIKTIAYGDPVQGYPSLMVAVLFMGSVQLIFVGILGEYLGRIFNETKQRPLYLVGHFEPSSLAERQVRR